MQRVAHGSLVVLAAISCTFAQTAEKNSSAGSGADSSFIPKLSAPGQAPKVSPEEIKKQPEGGTPQSIPKATGRVGPWEDLHSNVQRVVSEQAEKAWKSGSVSGASKESASAAGSTPAPSAAGSNQVVKKDDGKSGDSGHPEWAGGIPPWRQGGWRANQVHQVRAPVSFYNLGGHHKGEGNETGNETMQDLGDMGKKVAEMFNFFGEHHQGHVGLTENSFQMDDDHVSRVRLTAHLPGYKLDDTSSSPLNVRMLGRRAIIVNGQQQDGALVHQWQRSFKLPKGCDPDGISVTYSAKDGNLTVEVPRKNTTISSDDDPDSTGWPDEDVAEENNLANEAMRQGHPPGMGGPIMMGPNGPMMMGGPPMGGPVMMGGAPVIHMGPGGPHIGPPPMMMGGPPMMMGGPPMMMGGPPANGAAPPMHGGPVVMGMGPNGPVMLGGSNQAQPPPALAAMQNGLPPILQGLMTSMHGAAQETPQQGGGFLAPRSAPMFGGPVPGIGNAMNEWAQLHPAYHPPHHKPPPPIPQNATIDFVGCYGIQQLKKDKMKYYGDSNAAEFISMYWHAKNNQQRFFAMTRHAQPVGHAYTFNEEIPADVHPSFGNDRGCFSACEDDQSRTCGCAHRPDRGFPNFDCAPLGPGAEVYAVYKIKNLAEGAHHAEQSGSMMHDHQTAHHKKHHHYKAIDDCLIRLGKRTQDELDSMSAEDKRNTIIVVLNQEQFGKIGALQAKTNDELLGLCHKADEELHPEGHHLPEMRQLHDEPHPEESNNEPHNNNEAPTSSTPYVPPPPDKAAEAAGAPPEPVMQSHGRPYWQLANGAPEIEIVVPKGTVAEPHGRQVFFFSETAKGAAILEGSSVSSVNSAIASSAAASPNSGPTAPKSHVEASPPDHPHEESNAPVTAEDDAWDSIHSGDSGGHDTWGMRKEDLLRHAPPEPVDQVVLPVGVSPESCSADPDRLTDNGEQVLKCRLGNSDVKSVPIKVINGDEL